MNIKQKIKYSLLQYRAVPFLIQHPIFGFHLLFKRIAFTFTRKFIGDSIRNPISGDLVFNVQSLISQWAIWGIGELGKSWHEHIRSKKNPIVVDIGSNIGEFGNLVLSLNPGTKCFAIEPQEELKPWNKHFYGFYCVAISSSNKNATLTNGCGWTASTKDGFYDGDAIDVPATTLDELCKMESINHIDVLKIDVDGAEQDVFDGASRMLNRCDWIIVESNGALPSGFDWVTNNGYDFVGKRKTERKVNYHAEEGQEEGQVNPRNPGHRAPVAGELKGGCL